MRGRVKCMAKTEVLIVGAGLAGLACARRLHKEGVECRIVEASDAPGGRVRTDAMDGFLLDRGFQVLLTAYPEAIEQLNYDALELCGFISGALVRYEGRFHRMMDPWRERGAWIENLFSPVGKLGDKLRMASLRGDVLRKSVDDIFAQPETSALQCLKKRRFSSRIRENFFKPLFGGAMLDTKLGASSRMFEFVFKMFAEGDAAVPASGMGEIPKQMAATLPEGWIEYGRRVHSIAQGHVKLTTGEVLEAETVVVATEGPEAMRLLGDSRHVAGRSVCCLYFSCKEPPLTEPLLVVSGSQRGPITNMAVMSAVSPRYAPAGEHLVSVSTVGWPSRDDQSLVTMVRGQLKRWYGLVTEEWRLLRIYRIEHGLPSVYPLERLGRTRIAPGLSVCGDHRATPSIQGALESGRRAAEVLLRERAGDPDPEPSLLTYTNPEESGDD